MKKIIAVLFSLQLIVLGIISLLTMRMNSFDALFFDNRTEIELHFFDNLEHFEYFLIVIEEQEIPLSRAIFTDFDSMKLYTTDPTFEGFIELYKGQWPLSGTEEFISNVIKDSDYQVGLMYNQFPQFNIEIRYLSGIQNFNIDGTYHIHTTDITKIMEIEEKLNAIGISVLQIQINDSGEQIIADNFSGIILMSSITEIMFSFLIPIITFIVIISTLISYSLNSIKRISIHMLYGYSIWRSIFITVRSLLRPLLLAGIFTYSVLFMYIYLSNFTFFLLDFTLIFLTLYSILIIIYLMIIITFLCIMLSVLNTYHAIKGFKPDYISQMINQGLKILFTCIILIAGHFAISQGRELIERQRHLNYWEIAQDIYRIPQSHIWNDSQLDYEYTMRLIDFYDILVEDYNAFIMNSSFIEIYETHGFPMLSYSGISSENSLIHPFINRIDITLNYLNLNPIKTVNDIAIEEQIIVAPNTLNLLVPYNFSTYEDEIKTLYRIYFYNQYIKVANDLRYSFDIEVLPYQEEDVEINIIYVFDEQSYFSFNTNVRPETGNKIIDPIAVIQTGNTNFTQMASLLSQAFYFYSYSDAPFNEISDVVQDYGLSYIIRFVYSVFGENTEMLATLEADMLRHMVMIISLVIGNLMISYSLISNYFWKNKFALFIKNLSGFSLMKKHGFFILSYLSYIITVTIIITLFLGINIIIISMLLLIVDLVFFIFSERRLMKKSFSEMMKGER